MSIPPRPVRPLHARQIPIQLSLFDLPVLCCSCSGMRSGPERWTKKVVSPLDYPNIHFSHSICPACFKRLYPQFAELQAPQSRPAR